MTMPQLPEFDGCILLSEKRLLPSIPSVYFVFNKKGILYIGKSGNLKQRIAGHHRIRQFRELSLETKVGWLAINPDELNDTEYYFIKRLSPRFNGEKIDRKYKGKIIASGINLPSSMWNVLRERKRKYGSTISWQIRQALQEYWRAIQALSTCGIAGIYGEFTGPADAIEQMATYIKERDDEVMPMDVLEME